MPAKLSEGDTVGMAGEVTIVHDDGSVAVRLHGFGTPITTSGEHLSLVAKRKPEPGRRKRCATCRIRRADDDLSAADTVRLVDDARTAANLQVMEMMLG